MRELQPGLWHWRASHPDWTAGEPWPREVSSYALDDGARLLLFDPLALPDELLELAIDREPAVVLTAPWHERDTRSLVERLGAPVYALPPDTADDLIQKFGITAEQAGDGSPDLAWLRAGDAGEWHPYAAGDRLPFGIEAFAGREHNDMVLWVEDRNTVVCGDTLVDFGDGFELGRWLRAGVTCEQVVAGLRPLLALPVEHVLPAHGAPTDRAALERALLTADA
ncbi:MAG: MBL fold metallo-hydrolase [Gaiellaceae bacterium MAG52_C11]|nr:MBL fold metallo-hydrolase [Candidatus Gaiellasilicea maunaloa]